MKLMIVLPRVPYPLDKGDKLRAFQQLKELSHHHEIILFCLSDKPISDADLAEVRKYCSELVVCRLSRPMLLRNLLVSALNGMPFQVGYFHHPRAQRMVDDLIAKHRPDHIYCQLIRTARYAAGHPEVPGTLDYMDAFSKGIERRLSTDPLYMKPLLWWEHRRLRQYEREIFTKFQHHTIISQQDRDCIPHPDSNRIAVVPNGIDTAFFIPLSREKAFDLIFHGNMSYPPNVDSVQFLVREVMPLVWQRRPEARILISGADPSPQVRRLAGDRVVVSGWVDDVRENYASARMLVAPMQISIGLQNKLLEAMVMGLPCITSTLANNALGARAGDQILTADSPQEYADQIIALIEDDRLAGDLGARGRDYVIETFSWPRATAILEELMQSAG